VVTNTQMLAPEASHSFRIRVGHALSRLKASGRVVAVPPRQRGGAYRWRLT
jgi:hypothetical protein